MSKHQTGPLDVTVEELMAAGFTPVATCKGKHWKIKCDGLPPITVSITPSCVHASNQARRVVRRIIAQNRR